MGQNVVEDDSRKSRLYKFGPDGFFKSDKFRWVGKGFWIWGGSGGGWGGGKYNQNTLYEILKNLIKKE